MVRGLDTFRRFFKDFSGNYILIGGAACDEHMTDAGLIFRATKDLDLVLIVEALNTEFVQHFWRFVREGGYETRQKSGGGRKYYRFLKPQKEIYPYQLELFARNPDLLDLADDTHLTPIPVDDDMSSLSAILMNDDYYGFTIENSEVEDDLHRAGVETLICLKAKAYLDLKKRKEKEEKIDERNINKHKNDVVRLAVLLSPENSRHLPDSIRDDMRQFMDLLKLEPPDYGTLGKLMGVPRLDEEVVVNQIKHTFILSV
ncbi:MAG: hypothetical protein B1H11_11115 [Desulfobacteraceae bacterium 4484_190.1]|nr:MAG: hypothetical protein B1H11_11115 [Desulfobacteraceae bacterium 4484_190.1]